MRLFFAVFPPPEVQQAAFSVEDSLRYRGDDVAWVKRENLHYTLRFMGELGEDGARRAAEAAREAVAGRRTFTAVLEGLGAFPNARRARVLWISMTEGADQLTALARALEEALRKRGFDRADHPFSPHLTVGRVRVPREDWTARLAAAKLPDPATLRFAVSRLLLMESQLSPKGSIYSVRAEAPLEA